MEFKVDDIVNPFTVLWSAIIGVVGFFTGRKRESRS